MIIEILQMVVPIDDCDILTINGKTVRSSYVSIIPRRIEQEKFMI